MLLGNTVPPARGARSWLRSKPSLRASLDTPHTRCAGPSPRSSSERPKTRTGGQIVRVAKRHDPCRPTRRAVRSSRIHTAGHPQPRTASRWRTPAAARRTRGYPPTAAMDIRGSQEPAAPRHDVRNAPAVNTMPEATPDAVADHAQIGTDTIQISYEEAAAALEAPPGSASSTPGTSYLPISRRPLRRERAPATDAVEIITAPNPGPPPDC